MKAKPVYRGEVLADISTLTEEQIAERIRHATRIDAMFCRILRRYRAQNRNSAAVCATANAMQSWLDLGLASIAAAEHRRAVSIFTQAQRI